MTCHLSGAEHSSQWNEKHFAHRVRTLVTMTFQVNNQNTEVGSTEIERQVAACFCTTRTNSSLKRHATTRTRASHSRLALTTSTSHKSDRTTTLRVSSSSCQSPVDRSVMVHFVWTLTFHVFTSKLLFVPTTDLSKTSGFLFRTTPSKTNWF